MDKIILQSVLYSTWVSATGTQVFQHFTILILAPGTRCTDEGTYTLLPSLDPNSSFPLCASLKVYVPCSGATVLHHFMPP